jgi:hypothetical protein
MKRLLIMLALFAACATLPSTASAGWRHRCYGPNCGAAYGANYGPNYTPYYYRGYYSSAYRWGGYYPYTANYWGAPGYGATWGFGFGGF